MDFLKQMWQLQQVEVEMVRLRKEWDHIKDLVSRESRSDLDAIRAGIEKAREQWQAIKEEYDAAVQETQSIGSKLVQHEGQLYQQGGQSKELLSLQQKISELEKRKAHLEEEQLGYITRLDELEQRIANETLRLQRLEEQSRSRTARLAERQKEIKSEYGQWKEQREKLREEVPGYMLVIYNDLVAQKKRPMALLKEASCGACGIEQSVLSVNALKKGNQYTRCSSCGRILVPQQRVADLVKEDSDE